MQRVLLLTLVPLLGLLLAAAPPQPSSPRIKFLEKRGQQIKGCVSHPEKSRYYQKLLGELAALKKLRPGLERRDDRVMPATATWIGPAKGSWTTAANWSWDDPARAANHPGDTANRSTDAVEFTGPGITACNLNTDLAARLKGFSIRAGFRGEVRLDGNVTVGGWGLDLGGGTVTIARGRTLELQTTEITTHEWRGGVIGGGGTLKINGGVLRAFSAASSLGPNLIVTNGTFQFGGDGLPVHTNFALAGSANGISVQSGGLLWLGNDNPARNPYESGGITGGENHVIRITGGGALRRGAPGNDVGGAVLVDCPVTINNGNLELYAADTASGYAFSELKIRSALGGHGLQVTGSGGTIFQQAHTHLEVPSGVWLNSADAVYQVWVRNDTAQGLTGDLTFGLSGGALDFNRVGIHGGQFTLTGDLTCRATSKVYMNWADDDNDYLDVSGSATLAGTLKVWGDGPTKGLPRTLLEAGKITGTFNTLQWQGRTSTLTQSVVTPPGGWPGWKLKWTR